MIRRPIQTLALPAFVVTLLTIVVTWPQMLHLATRVGAHDDPMFSMWRLAWVAHALTVDPRHLFDGNIFYPAARTLTFSDAMILQGALAAPFLWLGASPIVVYNVMLLGSFAAGGLAMFLLARHVLGADGPALVPAAIFTTAPYRIEHFMHLELQWAMWVPLTLWSIHRTFETRSWRYGLLTGVFLWLQALSSVYYGVFLAIAAALFVALMLAAEPRAVRAVPRLAAGVALALALVVPYVIPYMETSRVMGPRPLTEVAAYSAHLTSYLASPPQSWLWHWTSDRWGGPELSLFPGAVAILLGACAVLYRPRRIVFVYAALAVVAIELSLGLNGFLYSWLVENIGGLRGLRSPSRFAIISVTAIAMLAGFGTQALLVRLEPDRPRARAPLIAAALLLVALDNATRGMFLVELRYDPPNTFNVYRTIRALGPGAVLELPIAKLGALPGREAWYMFWSIAHWQPLVNGYSGYYPREFAETVVRTENFPDDRSLLQLSNVGVRYIVVHRAFYEEKGYRELLAAIQSRPELRSHGKYSDSLGEAYLFVLEK